MQDLNDKVTGNTLTASEWNEVPSEIQNVIESSGQTLSPPSPLDVEQLAKGVAIYSANADYYTDSGAADAYVFNVVAPKKGITAYQAGQRFRAVVANPNTGGAATANVNGLGVKSIKKRDGTDPLAGDVSGLVEFEYDGTNIVIVTGEMENATVNGILNIPGSAISAPNGFAVNTDKLVLDGDGQLGVGQNPSAWGSQYKAIEMGGDVSFLSGDLNMYLMSNLYRDSSGDYRHINNGVSTRLQLASGGILSFFSSTSGTAGNVASLTEGFRLTGTRYFKASNTGTYGSVAGLGDLSASSNHVFQNSAESTACVVAANSGTTVGVIGFDSYLPAGAAGFHFRATLNAAINYQVLANGNVQNTNNSYGAISDRKLKNLLRRKYGKDYYERFKLIQFWVYTLINDPTNQELLGVVAQELQDIFPGLVESTPDTEEVKKTRTVTKQVQRTRAEQQTKTSQEVKEINGIWTLVEATETVDAEVPVFEEHQVFDQDGKPVMQLVKRGVPELLDADGKALQPAIDPVYAPLVHRVPIMDEVQEQEEYTEMELTGEVTLSVKYSILYQIAAMVTQELQFRNDEHAVKIGEQAVKIGEQSTTINEQAQEIKLLTSRIEALEAK